MYSYLTFASAVALVGLVFLALATGNRRKFMLWSAALAAPTGLADVWFAPDYWQPDHLVGPNFSVEGVLFSFGNGAILGYLVWPLFRSILTAGDISGGPPRIWFRSLQVMLPGFLVFLLVWDRLGGPLPIMQASFSGFLALAVWLGFRRRLHLGIGLLGALMFASIYWVQTLLWAWFDPNLAAFWPARSAYLGFELPITGLPGDELLWAAFYGLLWPHITAVAVGARNCNLQLRLPEREQSGA